MKSSLKKTARWRKKLALLLSLVILSNVLGIPKTKKLKAELVENSAEETRSPFVIQNYGGRSGESESVDYYPAKSVVIKTMTVEDFLDLLGRTYYSNTLEETKDISEKIASIYCYDTEEKEWSAWPNGHSRYKISKLEKLEPVYACYFFRKGGKENNFKLSIDFNTEKTDKKINSQDSGYSKYFSVFDVINIPGIGNIIDIVPFSEFVSYDVKTRPVGTTTGDFSVDGGIASYSVSVEIPPGTGGMAPAISLDYASSAGNGLLGVGWSLGGFSCISRCEATIAQDGFNGGINYDENDRFCLNGQRLILVSEGKKYGDPDTEYRTEIESFSRIVYKKENGDSYFKVWLKNGHLVEYGTKFNNSDELNGAVIKAENKPDALAWMQRKVSDNNGNYFLISYDQDESDEEEAKKTNTKASLSMYATIANFSKPKRILYTGNDKADLSPFNRVEFEYEHRNDQQFGYLDGKKVEFTQRLAHVKTYADDILVKNYVLQYRYSSRGTSVLKQIQECDVNGLCFSPIKFNWIDDEIKEYETSQNFLEDNDNSLPVIASYNSNDWGTRVVDINGDGYDDIIELLSFTHYSYNIEYGWIRPKYVKIKQVLLNNKKGGFKRDENYVSQLPDKMFFTLSEYKYFVVSSKYYGTELADINGDGLLDLIQNLNSDGKNGRFYGVYLNDGKKFYKSDTYTQSLAKLPRFALYHEKGNYHTGTQLQDINGDGLLDLVGSDKKIYLNLKNRFSTEPHSTYEVPTDILDSNRSDLGVRFADINGDGLVDVVQALYVGTHKHVVWLNTGNSFQENAKYTDSLKNTEVFFSLHDGEEYRLRGTRLIDINADGLLDIIAYTHTASHSGVFLNTGEEFVYDEIYTNSISQADNEYGHKLYITSHKSVNNEFLAGYDMGTEFLDINGDGLVDIIQNFTAASVASAKYSLDEVYGPYATIKRVYLNTGKSFYYDKNLSKTLLDKVDAFSHGGHGRASSFANLDGDNLIDVIQLGMSIYVGSDTLRSVHLSDNNRPLYISEITTNLNANKIIIEYEKSVNNNLYKKDNTAKFPNFDTGASTYLVSSVTTNSGAYDEKSAEIDNVVYYQYAGLKWNRQGRGNLGFRCLTQIDTSNKTITRSFSKQEFPFIGKTERTEISLYRKQMIDIDNMNFCDVDNEDVQRFFTENTLKTSESLNNSYKQYSQQYSYGSSSDKITNTVHFPYLEQSEQFQYLTSSQELAEFLDLGYLGKMIEYLKKEEDSIATRLLSNYSCLQNFHNNYYGNINEDNVYSVIDLLRKCEIDLQDISFQELKSKTVVTNTYQNYNSKKFSVPYEDPSYGQIISSSSKTYDQENQQVSEKQTDYKYELPFISEQEWLLGRVKTATVINDKYGTSDIDSTELVYDGNKAWQIKDKISAVHTRDEKYMSSTTYRHDLFGNVTQETIKVKKTEVDNNGNYKVLEDSAREVKTEYDTRGQFPLYTTNTKGQREKIDREYDRRFGLEKAVSDANGMITENSYDDFGRLTRTEAKILDLSGNIQDFDDNFVSTKLEWCAQKGVEITGAVLCPAGAIYKSTTKKRDNKEEIVSKNKDNNDSGTNNEGGGENGDTKGDSNLSYQIAYKDKLGRDIRVETEGFDGRKIFVDTIYNKLGQKVKVSNPYFEGEIPLYTEYQYDALGRVENIISNTGIKESERGEKQDPIKIITHTDYNGLETTVIADKGDGSENKNQTKKTINNIFGKLESNIEYVEYANNPGSLKRITTTYKYNANDQQTHIIQAGNEIVTEYDVLGRKISMTDPDLGTWEYRYNGFGELIWQKDNKGQITKFHYDKLGRKIHQEASGKVVRWIYDTALNSAGQEVLGALHCVVGPTEINIESVTCDQIENNEVDLGDTYVGIYKYNQKNLLESTLTLIDGERYLESIEYDNYSRPKILTYPYKQGEEKFKIQNLYNEIGFLSSVKTASGTEISDSNKIYWTLEAMNSFGQVLKEKTNQDQVTTQYKYNDYAQKLTAILTGTESNPTSIQDLHYQYDRLGNMRTRTDKNMEITEGTLKVKNVASNSSAIETFSYDALNRIRTSQIKGDEIQKYIYDDNGNITFKTGVGTYTYDPNDKPHAVRTIKKEGSDEELSYEYDDNGNMTFEKLNRNGQETIVKEMIWNEFNKPTTIIKHDENKKYISEFYYGPDQSRYKQVKKVLEGDNLLSENTTYYLGNYERIVSSGQIEHQRYVFANGKRKALEVTLEELEAETIPGDLNGDGRISASDVVLVLNMMVGNISGVTNISDINNDGKIGLQEAIYILNILKQEENKDKVKNTLDEITDETLKEKIIKNLGITIEAENTLSNPNDINKPCPLAFDPASIAGFKCNGGIAVNNNLTMTELDKVVRFGYQGKYGNGEAKSYDLEEAQNYCASLDQELPGSWRLPTEKEIKDEIFVYRKELNFVFPMNNGYFWTSTPHSQYSQSQKVVQARYNNGILIAFDSFRKKTEKLENIVCVRKEEEQSSIRKRKRKKIKAEDAEKEKPEEKEELNSVNESSASFDGESEIDSEINKKEENIEKQQEIDSSTNDDTEEDTQIEKQSVDNKDIGSTRKRRKRRK